MAAELAETDRVRRDLVANVSHELRTPITALQAVLENLVDGVEPPDPETLRTMLAQVERLGRLVQQLLDLSRLESGGVPLDRRAFDVEPMLELAIREARLARRRRQARSVDVEPPDSRSTATPNGSTRWSRTSCENAVRHSPSGRRRSRCAHRAVGDAVRIEVDDEDPASPTPTRRACSNASTVPTRRARPTTGGAGLGLAIARWIVDLHDGDIHVESREPHGCRMVVTIPGRVDVTPSSRSSANPTARPHQSRGTLTVPLTPIEDALRRIRRGEMVLVVDDEDRENEGDLTLAAEWVTPEAINFMLRWARGLVCMPCERLAPRRARDRPDGGARRGRLRHRVHGLDRPPRVGERHRRGRPSAHGAPVARRRPPGPTTSCGPATCSRCAPAKAACSNGVVTPKLQSTSRASPGLAPVAVICEVLHDDGSPARFPYLEMFAQEHRVAMISVAQVVDYRISTAEHAVAARRTLL